MPVHYLFYTPAGQFTFTVLDSSQWHHNGMPLFGVAVPLRCRCAKLPLPVVAVIITATTGNGSFGQRQRNGTATPNNGMPL